MFLEEELIFFEEKVLGMFFPTILINESFITVQDLPIHDYVICDDVIKNLNKQLSA